MDASKMAQTVACERCSKLANCRFACPKSCGVGYCSRVCYNTDKSEHDLNCEKTATFGHWGCHYCYRLVESKAQCADCQKVFVCSKCIRTKKHLGQCGDVGISLPTLSNITRDIETQLVTDALRDTDIIKERLYIVFVVPYVLGAYLTEKATCVAVPYANLEKLTFWAPTLRRFNDELFAGRSRIAGAIIICRDSGGNTIGQQYKTIGF